MNPVSLIGLRESGSIAKAKFAEPDRASKLLRSQNGSVPVSDGCQNAKAAPAMVREEPGQGRLERTCVECRLLAGNGSLQLRASGQLD